MYRIAAGIFALLFLLGGAVQLNDPDPAVWVGIYAASGLIAGLAAAGQRVARFPALAIAVVALAWGGYLGVGVVTQGQYLFDEEGRESMGLLIIAAWNLGVFAWGRK